MILKAKIEAKEKAMKSDQLKLPSSTTSKSKESKDTFVVDGPRPKYVSPSPSPRKSFINTGIKMSSKLGKNKHGNKSEEHSMSLLEQLNKLDAEKSPRFLASLSNDANAKTMNSSSAIIDDGHFVPHPPSQGRRPSVSLTRRSIASVQSERSSFSNAIAAAASAAAAFVNEEFVDCDDSKLREVSGSASHLSCNAASLTATQSPDLENINRILSIVATAEDDSEGEGIIMVAKPKKTDKSEKKSSCTKAITIYTNAPNRVEAAKQKKKEAELNDRLQKLMKIPQKLFENSKKVFSNLSRTAEKKISNGYEGCSRLLDLFKEIQEENKSKNALLELECKKNAFLLCRSMKGRFKSFKLELLNDRFECDIPNIRKAADAALFDVHMKNLSEAKWFVDIILKLKEYNKKSKSVSICCLTFLHVIMQMVAGNVPLDSSTFYIVMEETVVDKEEHKCNAVLHRVLKSVREIPQVGIEADKFLQYFIEKRIQPNPLLLAQVRSMRTKRAARKVRPSSMKRHTFSRPDSRGGIIQKDVSIASLRDDASYIDSEQNDDDTMPAESEWDEFEALYEGKELSGHPSVRGSFISDEETVLLYVNDDTKQAPNL